MKLLEDTLDYFSSGFKGNIYQNPSFLETFVIFKFMRGQGMMKHVISFYIKQRIISITLKL